MLARSVPTTRGTSLPIIPAPVILSVFSLGLWVAAISGVNPRQMNDLGLVSVLPPGAFIALGLLLVSFAFTLRKDPLSRPLLVLHVGVLIFMLYGVTSMVEEVPRFTIAYRHIGIAEYISRNGAVDPLIDAYHNWPGFFALTALVADAAGLKNALVLTTWAPVWFGLLYLGPLLLILRSATGDERVVWLGVWFFYLTNWIGQDYYAPQAFNFFLHLLVMGSLLTWFRPRGGALHTGLRWLDTRLEHLVMDRADDAPAEPLGGGQPVRLLAVLLLVLAAIVSSHQLTPFLTLASITVLVLFGRLQTRGLPLVLGVLIAAWAIFPAVAFFQGHFGVLLADAGAGGSSIEANVTNRIAGSPEHVFIVRLRLAYTGFIWALAGLGLLQRLRKGRLDLSLLILAAVPFPFLVLQPYGGEMLLRVYLFMLPAVVFLIASTILPSPATQLGWRRTGALIGVSCALLLGFLFVRYGNERMDFYTQHELAALEYLYEVAAPFADAAKGSDDRQRPLVLAVSYNMPWRYRDYERYQFRDLTPMGRGVASPEGQSDTDRLFALMDERRSAGAFLILTRSEGAELQMMKGLPEEVVQELRGDLVRSGLFRIVYENPDATIFVLEDPPGGPSGAS
jgi:hypothetical protein